MELIRFMKQPTLNIIIPSIGYPTLRRTIDSILSQELIEGDLAIVIGDGHIAQSKAIVEEYNSPYIKYIDGPETHCWGNAQRNFVLDNNLLEGDVVGFVDEDDIHLPDAFKTIRYEISQNYGKVLMFQFETFGRSIVWFEKKIQPGWVGGHCIYAPNIKEKLGRWIPEEDYIGDYHFIRSTVDLLPNKDNDVIWINKVIADARPHTKNR